MCVIDNTGGIMVITGFDSDLSHEGREIVMRQVLRGADPESAEKSMLRIERSMFKN